MTARRSNRGYTSALLAFTLTISYAQLASAAQPLSTAFTYQGQVLKNGVPVNGACDLRFGLWDTPSTAIPPSGGTQLGGVQTVPNVVAGNGGFSVTLNANGEFGVNAFNGDARWLQLAVRAPAGSGSYTTLSPRQLVTASPYALQTRGIFVGATGNVGIGTRSPSAKLDVEVSSGDGFVGISGSGRGVVGQSGGAYAPGVAGYCHDPNGYGVYGISNLVAVFGNNPAAGTYGYLGYNGASYKCGAFGYGNTANGVVGLSQNNDGVYGISHHGAKSGVYGYNDGAGVGVTGRSINGVGVQGVTNNASSFGGYFLNNAGGPALLADGIAQIKVLEILGGADLAERFDLSEPAEPGMVVAIDPAHPGQLCVSRAAYNHCVAGVISGARRLEPGVVLGAAPADSGRSRPVALNGRVWVFADAREKAVEPGDLMTTAERPGHAMPVLDPARAQGAVLGKAMTGLPKGRTDLVLVLVNLQ